MNIISLIAGNACSLFAMGSDAISASRKSINSMLWIQNISQLFYAIGLLSNNIGFAGLLPIIANLQY